MRPSGAVTHWRDEPHHHITDWFDEPDVVAPVRCGVVDEHAVAIVGRLRMHERSRKHSCRDRHFLPILRLIVLPTIHSGNRSKDNFRMPNCPPHRRFDQPIAAQAPLAIRAPVATGRPVKALSARMSQPMQTRSDHADDSVPPRSKAPTRRAHRPGAAATDRRPGRPITLDTCLGCGAPKASEIHSLRGNPDIGRSPSPSVKTPERERLSAILPTSSMNSRIAERVAPACAGATPVLTRCACDGSARPARSVPPAT